MTSISLITGSGPLVVDCLHPNCDGGDRWYIVGTQEWSEYCESCGGTGEVEYRCDECGEVCYRGLAFDVQRAGKPPSKVCSSLCAVYHLGHEDAEDLLDEVMRIGDTCARLRARRRVA